MDTASQVLVATSARSRGRSRARDPSRPRAGRSPRALRPVNDVLQTLPPARLPHPAHLPHAGIPPCGRDRRGSCSPSRSSSGSSRTGLGNVEPNAVEAATCFGATRKQVLLKVRIPLAQDAIMLGVNQGIIMVLAVVVIGGLVGSPGLGYEVARGSAARTSGSVSAHRWRSLPSESCWIGSHVACAAPKTGEVAVRSAGTQSQKIKPRTDRCQVRIATAARRARGARRRCGRSARRLGDRASAERSAKCGSLTLDENAWAGATANVYVLKYVLEKNFGCYVNIAKLPESTPLFQAMADGKVDAVPEDWNNIDLKVNQKFFKRQVFMDLGSNGVHRAHRLVRPDVPDEAAPRAQVVDRD